MYKFCGFIHRKGKSKQSGNDYDFYQCFFLQKLNSMNGNADGYESISMNVNADMFYEWDLAGNVDKDCSIVFDRFGRIVQITF